MDLTRRGFFKATALAFAGSVAFELSQQSQAFGYEGDTDWKLVNTEEYTNICCYCAGGCGTIASVRDGKLINVEGDPDHPVNEGALCPKGAAIFQLVDIVDDKTGEIIENTNRITKPMVRRPGSGQWEEISWEDAIDEIARHVKTTRDETFIEKDATGLTVNRTEAIASLGGSQQNSEEEYIILKLMRSLGLVAIDNQARVCHSSTVVGLAPTFGRGSMTCGWEDFQNTDYILTCGSNNAENHPISMKWVHRAIDRGAKWIVVDPRFTRSAALADLYCPIRSGTDVAFYGGMINYILEHDLWQHEYVLNYTNMAYLIDPNFSFDPATGLFSGWDESTKRYSTSTWVYQTESESTWDTSASGAYAWVSEPGVPEFTPPVVKTPKKDMTLQDPNCVYQLMKKHYSRYTLDMVSQTCGMDIDVLKEVYATYTASGAPDKSGTILYALGQTQHTNGTANTRAMCIVQLLLGNIGVPGGGLSALRGEPNVQGATDMCMLTGDLPGYMHWPNAHETPSLKAWCEHETYSSGYYTNKPKFLVSFLKSFFGENATVENDYGYDWLPKVENPGNWTTVRTFEHMDEGTMKGYFALGMNPAHSSPNARFVRESLSKLDWLVATDLYMTETADFWEGPGMDPSQIQTECYFLPVASILEKPGTILNSGRILQWRQQAIEPRGDSKNDIEIMDLLHNKIVELYQKEGGVAPEPILNTKWDYYVDGKPDFRPVAWELNGYTTEDGKLLDTFSKLKADGSTACGMWIYTGYYANEEAKLDPSKQNVARRGHEDPGNLGLHPNWAFSWPANRRILYNRASCDMEGKPWNPNKAPVSWDGTKWITNDVADFVASKDGVPVPPDNKAFIMRWEQNACLFSNGVVDMPFPEHYEPLESPAENKLNGSHSSPMVQFAENPSVKKGDPGQYPIVATTYSITEHWQTGGQSHSCPALNEVQPHQFCEISEELAAEKGIKNGDWVRVFNNRGSAKMQAMVTHRLVPLDVHGQTVHEIGMVHHWGWANTFTQGDLVNELTPNVCDPNSYIPEYKAFLVDIEKA